MAKYAEAERRCGRLNGVRGGRRNCARNALAHFPISILDIGKTKVMLRGAPANPLLLRLVSRRSTSRCRNLQHKDMVTVSLCFSGQEERAAHLRPVDKEARVQLVGRGSPYRMFQ